MITLTLQLSDALNKKIENLAQDLNLKKEELIHNAIEDFIDVHEEFAAYSPEEMEAELEELKQVGIDIEAMIKEAAKELMREQALEEPSKKSA